EMLDLRRQLRRRGGTRRLAGGTGLLERRRLDENFAAAVVIVGGFERIAEPDRPPLALIAGEQLRPAPAFQHRLDLPGEIDSVADAGIHPEAAGRHEEMAGVAGEEAARRAIAFGNQLARQPVLDRENLDRERRADGTPHELGRIAGEGLLARHEIAVEDEFVAHRWCRSPRRSPAPRPNT